MKMEMVPNTAQSALRKDSTVEMTVTNEVNWKVQVDFNKQSKQDETLQQKQ